MKVIDTEIPDVKIIEPDVFGDERGFFMETWQNERYHEHGVGADISFVQDNLSSSRKNVLRGIHYQYKNIQAKLVYVLQGAVYDVAVDIRKGSPTFGKWAGVELSSDNRRQLYIPAGFAHGFCVLSETVLFAYKCSDTYNPEYEITIQWNDPEIDIKWPVSSPVLSNKDLEGEAFSNINPEIFPNYNL